MTALLTIEHLTMRFGGLTAVDDVSFVAEAKHITGVIGPNGAGKTTCFNCITGFYKPTIGQVTLAGRKGPVLLEQLPGAQIARQGVARTFQNIRLFEGMTVLENLLVAQHHALMRASGFTVLGLIGWPGYQRAERKAVDKARYWLDRTGLLKEADREAGTLPYGDQRRVEIARAMCTDPLLLCLDEPAAGLNPRESAELNQLLFTIRDQHGCGILLIEHDMSVVMTVCDHIVVLDYGRKISDGTPTEVKNDPAVVRAYLGEDEEAA
jgi:branched-chain amino acid transport system ATP-binding protein